MKFMAYPLATVVASVAAAFLMSWSWIWLAPAIWIVVGVYLLVRTTYRKTTGRPWVRLHGIAAVSVGAVLAIPASIVSVVMAS